MNRNYLTIGELPSCLTKVGDNIDHLRYSEARFIVNSELSLYKLNNVYIQFDVDDYDQLVATFYNGENAIDDSFVIKANKQEDLVEKVNKEYINIINKGKSMRKKMKKATNVAVVNKETNNVSCVSIESEAGVNQTELLVNIVSEHFAGSGCYHDVEKYIDVPLLFNEKTGGAVEGVIFGDATFTLQGKNNFSMKCNVDGLDQTALCRQVSFMLQVVLDWDKQEHENKANVNNVGTTSTKEKAVEVKTEFSLKNKARKHTSLCKNSKKVVEEYNKAVYYKTTDLESELKGKTPSSSSQVIRRRLSLLANYSGLKTVNTSGQSLVSELNQENVELLREICKSARCRVPPFLMEKSTKSEARMSR